MDTLPDKRPSPALICDPARSLTSCKMAYTLSVISIAIVLSVWYSALMWPLAVQACQSRNYTGESEPRKRVGLLEASKSLIDLASANLALEREQAFYEQVSVGRQFASRTQNSSITNQSVSRRATNCTRGITHYLRVAVAYDNAFCSMFADLESVASDAVQETVNQAHIIFQEYTCVAIALVHIESHCQDPSDPYASFYDVLDVQAESRGDYILGAFQNVWEQSHKEVNRDVAYFFSGLDEGTATIGTAFIAGACLQSYGYGWLEGNDVGLFVHELGHSLGATHAKDGIMRPVVSDEAPFFSPASTAQITAFVDSRSLSLGRSLCLSPYAPTCDATCIRNCEDMQCVGVLTSPSPELHSAFTSPSAETLRPSPQASPENFQDTCKDTFDPLTTFDCSTFAGQPISIAVSSRKSATFEAKILQQKGFFKGMLRGVNGSLVRKVAARFSVKPVMTIGELGDWKNFGGGVAAVEVLTDAFSLSAPGLSQTCCGRDINMFVALEACVGKECVFTDILKRKTNILCALPCYGYEGGIVVPFSVNMTCPTCTLRLARSN